MRNSRLVLIALFLGGCAAVPQPRSAPAAAPVPTRAPRSIEAKPLPSKDEDLSVGDVVGPPGAPPLDHPAVCGNGIIEQRGYDRVCASCIPGRECPCGWAPRMEACDGSVPQGLTCERFGFNAGELRCTSQCELDTSGCRSVAPPTPKWRSQLVSLGREVSTEQSLAVNGNALLVAGTHGSTLTAARFDVKTRYPLGSTYSVSPPVAGTDATLTDVLVAPVGDRFLIATRHVGERSTLVYLTDSSGWPKDLTATIPGRPIAFGGGIEAGLLITTSGFVRLDASGHASARVRPLFQVAFAGDALHAAIASTEDGWIAAVAVRKGAESVARVDVARISANGEAKVTASVAQISDAYHPLSLAATGTRAYLVYVLDQSLQAAEVQRTGVLGARIRIGGGAFNRVLAAGLEGEVLTAWAATERGHLHRLTAQLTTGATELRDSIDFTAGFVLTGTVGAGAFFATFRSSTDEMLLYRENASAPR